MAAKRRAARAPGTIEPRMIYRALFTRIDEGSHACKLCPPNKNNIKKFHLSNGYTNMMTHLEGRHGDTYLQMVRDYLQGDHPPPAPPPEMKKTVSQPTENAAALYGWLELMVMEDLPFTFVESEAFRQISRWEAISREALMRSLSRTQQPDGSPSAETPQTPPGSQDTQAPKRAPSHLSQTPGFESAAP
jgi:hypothetical protein